MPNIGQIISFVLGIGINYGFGAASYAVGWNKSPAYTLLWIIINILALIIYAAVSFVRDKGLTVISVALSISSMVISFGMGIILIVWF